MKNKNFKLIKIKALILATLSLMLVLKAWADTPNLDNIDQADLDNITREISANFTHTTVAPAIALGNKIGLEAGVFGGATHSPKLDGLVKEMDSKVDASRIYHGGLEAMLTVPFGFTFEYTNLPVRRLGDIQVKSYSGALRWTLTHYFYGKTPIHFAIRGHFSKSNFSFKQRIQNTSTNNLPVDSIIVFDDKVTGGNAIISIHLLFFEPYYGVGIVRGRSAASVNASTTATIFDQNITQESTMKANSIVNGTHQFAGVHLDFWFIHMAFEYSRIFGTDKVTGKIALAI